MYINHKLPAYVSVIGAYGQPAAMEVDMKRAMAQQELLVVKQSLMLPT